MNVLLCINCAIEPLRIVVVVVMVGGGGGVMKVCLLGVCSLRHNPFNWLPSYYKKTFICLYAAQDTRK